MNSLSSSAAAWFCAFLIMVSMLAGVLIGDRYQPFGRGPNEQRFIMLEGRLDTTDRLLERLRGTLVQKNLPALETDAGTPDAGP